MKHFISTNKMLIISYLLIALLIILMNYFPGTFLVGWDNVFPELNFKNAFKVNLFSVWQEYRGLGVQDGLAHAANLVHTVILFLLSMALPIDMLRYSFHFLMLLNGMIGMYILAKKILKFQAGTAFICGLFYGLNPITVQMFYAPLEVFSVHFGMLPWLCYSVMLLLEKQNRKNFVLFFLIQLLATPQGFVPTVFIAYMALIICILIWHTVNSGFKSIRMSITVFGMIIFVNSFWLFPFVRGALSQGKVIKNTKINLISSEEIYQKNNYRGTLLDVLTMKGFMLDVAEPDEKSKTTFIMLPWRRHLTNPLVLLISFLFLIPLFIGIVRTLKSIHSRKQSSYPIGPIFIFLFLIGLFMLGTRIPILSTLNSAIRTAFPLFNEAFRFPFTKFSILYLFSFVVLSGYGYSFLFQHIFSISGPLIASIILVIYTFPVFQGRLFYDQIRLTIPKEYFSLIDFFKQEDKTGRIMTLPQSSYSNWLYYIWGARGSGFWWYGVEQPIMERPFDPWSHYNEQYFNEVYYAVQTRNKDLFLKTLQKYSISYIVVDGNIRVQDKRQQMYQLTNFIESLCVEICQTQYGFGKITVYKLGSKGLVRELDTLATIGSTFQHEFTDTAYIENGDYVQSTDWRSTYLFPSLFSSFPLDKAEYSVEVSATGEIIIKPKRQIELPNKFDEYFLEYTPSNFLDTLVPIEIRREGNTLIVEEVPIMVTIGTKNYSLSDADREIYTLRKSDSISQLVLNGEEFSPSERLRFLGLKKQSNSILVQYNSGAQNTFLYTPTTSGHSRQMLNLQGIGHSAQVFVTLPIMQPRSLVSTNLLTDKKYKIDTPCYGEEKVFVMGQSYFNEISDAIILNSRTSSTCFHLYLTDLQQRYGSAIFIKANNNNGLLLRASVDVPQQKAAVIETKLADTGEWQALFIPPVTDYPYFDYGFHLRNISYSQDSSSNTINKLFVSHVPLQLLKNIRVVRRTTNKEVTRRSSAVELITKHEFPFIFEASMSPFVQTNNPYIVLSQAFDTAWKAYEVDQCKEEHITCTVQNTFNTYVPFIFGHELSEHVLVNNWANGWVLPSTSGAQSVVIIFWPQFLEFIGFGLLVGTLLWTFFYKERHQLNN